MREIEAILFDSDGTLIDTVESSMQGFEGAFKEHGLPPRSRAEITKVLGLTLERCYELLAPDFQDINLLCESHRKFQDEHEELVSIFPDVLKIVDSIRGMGLKTAVVTSRSKKSSMKLLENLGLLKIMDTVICKEDSELQKPNPEPIQMALRRMGTLPKNAVMVGDTESDVMAGKAAGTMTIGVTYGSHGEKIAQSNPDYVVARFAEIMPVILTEMRILSAVRFE